MALTTAGLQDTLSVPVDVEMLLAVLPRASVVEHHVEAAYAHLDFGLGADTPSRVWPRVLSLARRYAALAGSAQQR